MTGPAAPGSRRRPGPRTAVTAVFLVHGLLFASWTAHIPLVKARLGLGDGTLGLALLGAPIGSISATVLAGALLPRLGSRRLVRICLVGYGLIGIVLGQAGSVATLFAALVAWGMFQGLLDVSMNTQAITVERHQDRPLMSGLHGCWSIGSFLGAGAGILGVALGLSLSAQMLVLGLPTLLVVWTLTTRMVADAEPTHRTAEQQAATSPSASPPSASPVRRLNRVVMLLGAIAFASMLCEGATADWGSVYLHGSLHAGTAEAGSGYASFSFAMVAVRLGGNRLLTRFPPRRLLPVLAGVATVGFAAGLLSGSTVGALIGFACLGLGLGSIVPTVFSAAGRQPGAHAGTSVATVAAFGWAGFVCGPPLIGQLASAASLPVALGLLPLLTALIVVATARTAALAGGSGFRLLRPGRSRPAAG